MKQPKKLRDGGILGDKFLVNTTSCCYKVNPEEQEIINEILIEHHRQPTKSIAEKYTGTKVPIYIRIDVVTYLEIEEELGKLRNRQIKE